jgi:hypothetical protein
MNPIRLARAGRTAVRGEVQVQDVVVGLTGEWAQCRPIIRDTRYSVPQPVKLLKDRRCALVAHSHLADHMWTRPGECTLKPREDFAFVAFNVDLDEVNAQVARLAVGVKPDQLDGSRNVRDAEVLGVDRCQRCPVPFAALVKSDLSVVGTARGLDHRDRRLVTAYTLAERCGESRLWLEGVNVRVFAAEISTRERVVASVRAEVKYAPSRLRETTDQPGRRFLDRSVNVDVPLSKVAEVEHHFGAGLKPSHRSNGRRRVRESEPSTESGARGGTTIWPATRDPSERDHEQAANLHGATLVKPTVLRDSY